MRSRSYHAYLMPGRSSISSLHHQFLKLRPGFLDLRPPDQTSQSCNEPGIPKRAVESNILFDLFDHFIPSINVNTSFLITTHRKKFLSSCCRVGLNNRLHNHTAGRIFAINKQLLAAIFDFSTTRDIDRLDPDFSVLQKAMNQPRSTHRFLAHSQLRQFC